MSLSPTEVELGPPKIVIFEIFQRTGMGKYIHFRAQGYKKYQRYREMLQTRIVQN